MALDTTAQLMLEAGAAELYADFERIWRDLHAYVECRHAAGGGIDEVLRPVSATLQYDIPRWIADDFPRQTAAYRLPAPRELRFFLAEEGARELESAFRVWSGQLAGLTKLVTRIRVQSQIRTAEFAEAAALEGMSIA